MAKKFNLQPWRERLRNEQKKKFNNTTAILFLATAGLAVFDKLQQDSYIESQEASKVLLKGEIEKLKKTAETINLIKEVNDEVEQQVKAIDKLQSQRGFTVELMDYIAHNTPDTVFLKSIEFSNKSNAVLIGGVAENDAGVAAFMANMQNFHRLAEGKLDKQGIFSAKSTSAYLVSDNTEIKEFTLIFPLADQDKKK